ncbi:Uncharacterised protein [Mycobacteroides abscessus subsp. abscessus]|nr:Uncharacterised protein [Mycobacteroides abscessus subsp. abscessus]
MVKYSPPSINGVTVYSVSAARYVASPSGPHCAGASGTSSGRWIVKSSPGLPVRTRMPSCAKTGSIAVREFVSDAGVGVGGSGSAEPIAGNTAIPLTVTRATANGPTLNFIQLVLSLSTPA